MKLMKKAGAVLLAAFMTVAFMPAMAFAAVGSTADNSQSGGGTAPSSQNYVTVNDSDTHYTSIDDAVKAGAKADANGSLTFHIHGNVSASREYIGGTTLTVLPNQTGAKELILLGDNPQNDTLSLTGNYSTAIQMENGTISVKNLSIEDRRDRSGESNDPDPWEFTYIMPIASNSSFENCNFKEGVLVGNDARFKDCDFTVDPNDPNFNNYEKTKGFSTHYGLWITHYGNVVVNHCHFHDIPYGGIKSVYGDNDYPTYRKKDSQGNYIQSNINLSVTNSTFDRIGNGEGHRPIHLDGVTTLTVKDNVFTDCWNEECIDHPEKAKIVNVKSGNTDAQDAINADYRGANTMNNVFRYSLKYEINGYTLTSPQYYDYAKGDVKVTTYKDGYKYSGSSGKVYSGAQLQTSTDISAEKVACISNGSANPRDYTLTKENPAVPLRYTVKFNANGGNGTMSDQTMSYDQEAPLTKNGFSRDGYTFTGWALTKDGSVKFTDGQKVKNLTEDQNEITLYAIWKQNESPVIDTPVTPTEPQKHEVTFHDDNASGDTPETTIKITVNQDGMVKKPATDPVRPGYTFDGWYADKECTIPFDFSKPVTGDVHIYAKWNKNVNPQTAKKVSGILMLKALAKGSSSQVLNWTPLSNVDGYIVYMAKCNTAKKKNKFVKVADITASAPQSFRKSGLRKGTAYKYYVAAYQIKNGKKKVVRKSLCVHSIAGNYNQKYTNAKTISVKKHAVALKLGKTYQINPSATGVIAGHKILQKGHAAMFRYVYIRDDQNVSVSKTGLVTAKKVGKCRVYVLGTNGVRTAVLVTVK